MHACAMDQRLDKQSLWNKTKAVFRTRYVIPFYSLIQGGILIMGFTKPTWWLIPLSKWVITPVINGISRVNPLITGVINHLLSGMSHQVVNQEQGGALII